jgi:hypothetical protein
MRYYVGSILLLLAILWMWLLAQGQPATQHLTLAWDPPPQGAQGTRVFQTRAGECVLNAAQYTALTPDIAAPSSTATLDVEVGGSYCWLVRYIDSTGQVGLPSYVLGYVVPKPVTPAPLRLRIPGTP